MLFFSCTESHLDQDATCSGEMTFSAIQNSSTSVRAALKVIKPGYQAIEYSLRFMRFFRNFFARPFMAARHSSFTLFRTFFMKVLEETGFPKEKRKMKLRRPASQASFIVLDIMALMLCVGCATLPRVSAVPKGLGKEAVISGISGARFYADSAETDLTRLGLESLKREKAFLASSGKKGPLPPVSFLAISGGGDDGAFGAGLLLGWTAAGTRPQFKVVTGISTGALIAPFAFLGADYDYVLKQVYTNVTNKDIFRSRSLLSVFYKDAIADTTPLQELLSRYVDKKMLNAVAAEYKRGRILLIGTTDLDSRKGVIWNMGQIAASESPKSLDLFKKVMLASAAIPGVFPPVLFDVEVNGKFYQEMDVDGGAVAQVFIYPPSFRLKHLSERKRVQRARRLYVIRNARLEPEWAEVERRTLPIARMAISYLIQNQGTSDLRAIYHLSQRDGIAFNLAYIPKTFKEPRKGGFDKQYMQKLFDLGYTMAVNGYPWEKTPPGLSPSGNKSQELTDVEDQERIPQ